MSRTYRNRDGQIVNVYLVTGSARHVTIHTPDWCYVGAGYDIIGGEPQQYTDAESGMEASAGIPGSVLPKGIRRSRHSSNLYLLGLLR